MNSYRKLTNAILLVAVSVLAIAPARAQVDLSGSWSAREHEDYGARSPGPEVLDYLGVPLNEAGRERALSYSTSLLSLPEHQCMYYPAPYILIGPQSLKITSENNPATGAVIAWIIAPVIDRAGLTIWMDGRPHPSVNAVHPVHGFTTGVWQGDVLTTKTTHMQEGPLTRNGAAMSDEATLTMHFNVHGDILTVAAMLEDPVYLAEPFVISRSWQLDPAKNQSTAAGPCVPQEELPTLKGEGEVPHYLPGKNPFLEDMNEHFHIPAEAAVGGPETMYPEYRKKLKDKYVPPGQCVRYCCGWNTGRAPNETTDLHCVGEDF
jgi:hypothetical protein